MASETATSTRLWVDAIDAKPVDFDWSHGYAEDEERAGSWDIVYPSVDAWTPAQCWQWMCDQGQTETPDFRDCTTADEVIECWRETVREVMQNEPDSFSPMMNYYYPLPELRMSAGDAQAALEQINTACVVALVGGDPVLALAGGGMDFSWDICRAYIALGYYPPVHFAGRLPQMGERDVRTAELALESCTIAQRIAFQNVVEAQIILEHTRELAAS